MSGASGSVGKSERQKKTALPLDSGEGGKGRLRKWEAPPEGRERLLFDWIAGCGEAQRRENGVRAVQSSAITTCDSLPATAAEPGRPPKLLDRVREALDARHYSQEPSRYGLRGGGGRVVATLHKQSGGRTRPTRLIQEAENQEFWRTSTSP